MSDALIEHVARAIYKEHVGSKPTDSEWYEMHDNYKSPYISKAKAAIEAYEGYKAAHENIRKKYPKMFE